MIIENIRKCGLGAELLIDGLWTYFNLDTDLKTIREATLSKPIFDKEKYEILKTLKGSEL